MAPVELVLDALGREHTALIDRMLDVFLEVEFDREIDVGGATVGHVATYLSREADRMADLLVAAAGRPVPAMSPRQWALDQGHLRPGAVIADDLEASTERLRGALADMRDWEDLDASSREVPLRRLLQVCVHHCDLGRPMDAMEPADAELALVAASRVLQPELSLVEFRPEPAYAELVVERREDGLRAAGPPQLLLAWGTGRGRPQAGTDGDTPRPNHRLWI